MTLDLGIPVFLFDIETQGLRDKPIGYMKSPTLAIGLKRKATQQVNCGAQGDLPLTLRQLVQQSSRGQKTIVGFVVNSLERKKLRECLTYCAVKTVEVD